MGNLEGRAREPSPGRGDAVRRFLKRNSLPLTCLALFLVSLERPPRPRPGAPWPVRRGGAAPRLYESSLFLALLALFLFSFAVHAVAGARAFSEEQLRHGGAAVGALSYLATSRFWLESFQNWQSEFLSVGVLAVLGIVLRQRGSPESKPVDARHAETGG
jgi:hypothetical protein